MQNWKSHIEKTIKNYFQTFKKITRNICNIYLTIIKATLIYFLITKQSNKIIKKL